MQIINIKIINGGSDIFSKTNTKITSNLLGIDFIDELEEYFIVGMEIKTYLNVIKPIREELNNETSK